MSSPKVSDAEYSAALSAGRAMAETNIRASAARYVPSLDAIEITHHRNGVMLVPRHCISALQSVSAEDLRELEVWPDGSAIEIERRDIHISVPGLPGTSA